MGIDNLKENILLKQIISFIATLTILATLQNVALAQDKQGKRSLETHTSRPKENKPSQSGTQRVQDQTRSKVNKTMKK